MFGSPARELESPDPVPSTIVPKEEITDKKAGHSSMGVTKSSDLLDTSREVEVISERTSQQFTTPSTPTLDNSTQVEKLYGTKRSIPHEIALVLTICFGQIMTLAPLGQMLGPMHIIGDSFDERSAAQLSWYMASYSLTAGTCVLVMGRLGDMFGHRKLFALGYAWLALWSLVAGLTVFTKNQIFFDVCRAMQGLGGAILVPNGLALLGLLYPPGATKAIVFCLFGAAAPTGAMSGAFFSSLFAQLAWWPWAFFAMAIVATFMIPAVFAFVPPPIVGSAITDKSSNEIDAGKQGFDWVGATTGVSGLILFNVAWNQAAVVGWSSPYVLVLLIMGIFLFAAFLVAERHASQPIVPVKDISAKVVLVLLSAMFGWSGFGIWVFYWFQFVEVMQDHTPLNAVAQLSSTLPASYAAALATFFLAMRTRSCWIMLGAAVAFCAGSIITVLTAPGTLFWKQLIWSCLVIPFGMDMSFPGAALMLSDIVPLEHQGIGASLIATTVHYSMAFGLGIAGTVEIHFNHGGTDILSGCRAAQWTGVGLTGAGVLVAMYFVLTDVFFRKATEMQESGNSRAERDV